MTKHGDRSQSGTEEMTHLAADERPRRRGSSWISGAAGAAAVTLVHEAVRRFRSDAPRMDKVGGRLLQRALVRGGVRPPTGSALYRWTLAGELISNGLYYASMLAGQPRRPMMRGATGGLLAGAAALLLPQRLGAGKPPRSSLRSNRLMTVGWYLIGGLVAAACFRQLSGKETPMSTAARAAS